MGRPKTPDSELLLDVNAYYEYGGKKSEAARSRGLNLDTYIKRLHIAESTLGIKLNKAADGRISTLETKKLPLPKKGHVKRYILTSAQNNTHVHPGFDNLLAYISWLDNLDKGSCELFVGTYSYQISAYGPKAVKRNKYDQIKAMESLWYAREIESYISDESIELAPGLVWCGEQNILPTNINPLTSFHDYNGTSSNILPHAKIAMESVPSMSGEYAKFNYSTGTITQRNYIQKRAGILAEQKHSYGACIVEVNDKGKAWVRQLHIDEDNNIMDVGPDGYVGVHICDKKVHTIEVVDGIYWGDIHAYEADKWVRKLAWGRKGMLDTLGALHQFMGDVFSMATRGHHDIKNFHSRYEKFSNGQESVEGEIELTSRLITEAHRTWCSTVVVPSNHDRHLERWLNEADFRTDPLNAKYFLLLQYQVLDAIDKRDLDFNILEWALRKAGIPDAIRFLKEDESCIVAGVENGLHGDLGPNGARGSTNNLTKLGRPINKGHDHKATIKGNVYSAGACATKFSYSMGPQSKSVSHIVTYKNGTRAIITMAYNKWRA